MRQIILESSTPHLPDRRVSVLLVSSYPVRRVVTGLKTTCLPNYAIRHRLKRMQIYSKTPVPPVLNYWPSEAGKHIASKVDIVQTLGQYCWEIWRITSWYRKLGAIVVFWRERVKRFCTCGHSFLSKRQNRPKIFETIPTTRWQIVALLPASLQHKSEE